MNHRLTIIRLWSGRAHQWHKPIAFTLVELLIAVSIFATITVLISGLFIDSFRQAQRVTLQSSVYEDARFIMDQITTEIENNIIDYDEYYNQHVVLRSQLAGTNQRPTYGQNFGRYYSAFFNPGSDNRLGYDCNDDVDPLDGIVDRNRVQCTPQRRTLDRATGQNPFSGKVAIDENIHMENAVCGTLRPVLPPAPLNNKSALSQGLCLASSAPTQEQVGLLPELYLITKDGSEKTILARERIGGTPIEPVWSLSRVRMEGIDNNNDGISDTFTCTSEYSCGSQECPLSEIDMEPGLPRMSEDLTPSQQLFVDDCDNADNGFVHDFIPISPLRIDVQQLGFIISPLEDPLYAFAEPDMQIQPRVTIVMTIRPNPEYAHNKNSFEPFTVVKTVTTRRYLEELQAPLRVE